MSGKRGGGGEHQGYRQSSVLDLRSCNADYSFPRSSRLARSAAGARVPRAAQARGHQLSASARRWRGSELAPPGARRNVTVPRKIEHPTTRALQRLELCWAWLGVRLDRKALGSRTSTHLGASKNYHLLRLHPARS
ncbi:unnamed protein product [Prorocentrum cordatum]|uniref:Uncharacterized protein n=1 Tax=Prorocentrum cordatum TaxID=2364126 RepID=A0ABN9V040_9DINO|nr:unnamed protein product [Polarella glacialis]